MHANLTAATKLNSDLYDDFPNLLFNLHIRKASVPFCVSALIICHPRVR